VLQIGLWGGGPQGEDLNVAVTGPPIVQVNFPPELDSLPVPNLRIFELTAVGPGQTTLQARVPGTDALYTAPLTVTVVAGGLDDPSLFFWQIFYHGTSLEKAKELMTMDLKPRSVPEARLPDVDEYTDFG
jgi:hypothetical protein